MAMEGFVLAAGLGTRLRPLTDDRPKALVEINGVTLLEHTIHTLEAAGIGHIVVNVHHFADKVVDFVERRRVEEEKSGRGCRIDISDEREMLLDTGGGLKKAAALFTGRENVLVHNVDILSEVDLKEVERKHVEEGNLVTLCVSRRETKRLLEFDTEGRLVGRAEYSSTTAERRLSAKPTAYHPSPNVGEESRMLAFSGISVVSPELFALLPEADHPYPVIDEYIRLSREGYRMGSYVHDAARWLDVGKPETLKLADTFFNGELNELN